MSYAPRRIAIVMRKPTPQEIINADRHMLLVGERRVYLDDDANAYNEDGSPAGLLLGGHWKALCRKWRREREEASANHCTISVAYDGGKGGA